MNIKKEFFLWLLLAMAAALHFLIPEPDVIEYYYSLNFFPALSQVFRMITGKTDFSIGDVLYGLAFAFLIALLIRFFSAVVRGNITKMAVFTSAKKILLCCLIIYLVFNVFWGINYNRSGIAGQITIQAKGYEAKELDTLNAMLTEKVNLTKKASMDKRLGYPGDDELFSQTQKAYDLASVKYPFLKYEYPSIKKSMWGWLGNYWGFTGYYNPFTGEAQLNTTVPGFMLPFAACHEVAHQLGYAKENEANFVSYLVAREYNDSMFLYSAYLNLFFYANRNLFVYDSTSAKHYRESLSADVKNDINELIQFNRAHRNFMEPIITRIYDLFLRSNRQPQGMLSYDEVTVYLAAYYRKFGDI